MINHQQASRFTSLLVYLVAVAAIGLAIPRTDSMGLMMAWLTACFCYVWIVRMESNFRLLLGLGILIRLTLFFAMPSLSDDIYRFLWDGKLLTMGINPYQFRPEEMTSVMAPEHFELLNSPAYYSVYPPMNQALFWLASLIADNNFLLATNVIRGLLLTVEIGSVFLMLKLAKHFNQPANIAMIYFLNPLVIIEVVGNVHFEGFMIFFLLLMLVALTKNRFITTGAALGMATATKLIPLIYLPFLTLRHRWKNGLFLASVSVIVFGISIVGLFNQETLLALKESLLLYSRKFEFNGSIYLIIREIGWYQKGYNPIETWGPWLSFWTFVIILLFSVYAAIKQWKIPHAMLWILMIYLLLATTVHPWYVLTLLPLGLLSGYYFPVIWSFLVFITYMGYQEKGFELSPFWIVVEYVIVIGSAIIEMVLKTQISKNE